jgi:hypothetical protein
VLETHLPRYLSSIVVISGWIRSPCSSLTALKRNRMESRSESVKSLFYGIFSPHNFAGIEKSLNMWLVIFYPEVSDEICDHCFIFSSNCPHPTTFCFITLWLNTAKNDKTSNGTK